MRAEYHVLFPFSRVPKGSRVVLYGAGDVGQTFYWQLRATGYCELAGWLDQKWEGCAAPFPMLQRKDLARTKYDYLVLAIRNAEIAEQVRDELAAEGVDAGKIVLATDCSVEFTLCGQGEGDAGIPFWRKLAAQLGVSVSAEAEDTPPSAAAHVRRKVKIGILTTGYIAATSADMIRRRIPEAEAAAVASREIKRAEQFAAEHGIPKAYGSYEALMEDPEIELIHVTSPAGLHYEHTLQCLEHGKHVLCEKPFALNENQAREMFALAREKRLLLADGMWTKHLPMAKKLVELCRSGVIGDVFAMSADCYYPGIDSDRINNNALGGGVLLENGLYLLSFTSLVFGLHPDQIEASGIINENGIDIQDEVVLTYGDRVSTLNFGIRGVSGRKGFIYGTRGHIEVQDANEYRKLIVYGFRGEVLDTFEDPGGYQYQMRACIQAIQNGTLRMDEHPPEDTLAMLRIADEVRRRIGVKYACD